MNSFSKKLTHLCFKYWPLILLAVIIMSAAGVPQTLKLFKTISTDAVDLLSHKQPNVQTLLKIREKLESGVRSYLVVESDHRDANINFIKTVAQDLSTQPFVGKVRYEKLGYHFFDKNKLMFLETSDLESIRDRIQKKIKKEKLLGLYIDFDSPEESAEDEDFSFSDLETKYKTKYGLDAHSQYNESKDGKFFSLTVESPYGETGVAAASRFHEALVNYTQKLNPTSFDPSMKIYLVGATKALEYKALINDLTRVGIISAILIFIPLLIRFTNPIHVLIVFLPLLLGIPISFFFTSFAVPRLNVCTSFLFSILGALGIENGIHIFSRYYQSRLEGLSIESAIEEIFSRTGRAIIVSVLSVAITFLAMVWNDFRGFSEFGLITSIGLCVLFLVYFTFMPALLIATEKFSILKIKKIEDHSAQSWFFPRWFSWGVLTCGILFTVFSASISPRLGFEFDSKKTRANIPETELAREKHRNIATRVNSPAMVIIQNKDEAEAIKLHLKKLAAEDKTSPTIDDTSSYYELLPKDQDAKLAVLKEIRPMLEDKTLKLLSDSERSKIEEFKLAIDDTAPTTEKDIPEEVTFIFKGKAGTPDELMFINALPKMELDDGRNAMQFSHDISKINVGGKIYYPSSDAIVYGKVLETMLADAPRVLIVAFFLVFFFVFLDFRHFGKATLVMTSIMLGVLWMLGVMWIFGVKLNFFNMIIVPAVLGMSIDNSIHLFHRYQELGKGSLGQVLASSGKAALIASCTNASAFIGLLFCNHGGLYSIGLLAVIGVTTCLLSTLVFFPVTLYFAENFLPGQSANA